MEKRGFRQWSWFHPCGFENDPLSARPCGQLVGREKEIDEMLFHLSSGNMGVVYGPNGSGKTSLLKHIHERKAELPELALHCINCMEGFGKIEAVVREKSRKGERRVLLLDECHFLTSREMEQLRQMYDNAVLYGVILCFPTEQKVSLPPSLQRRLAKQWVLGRLSVAECEELLKVRGSGKELLPSAMVRHLALFSKGNPRAFLLSCQNQLIHQQRGEEGTGTGAQEHAPLERREVISVVQEEQESVHLFSRLTPLQQRMVETLYDHPRTLRELSECTGSTMGTIGKQISLLSLSASRQTMKNKGIAHAVVGKRWESGRKMYSLTPFGQQLVNG